MKLRTTLLTLVTVFGMSATQANSLLSEFITFQDRVTPLPLEGYLQGRAKLLQQEEFIKTNLAEEQDTQTSLKQFCEVMDIKFERLALASANLQYDQAYSDFKKLKYEIEDEAQANYGIRHTCYPK